MPKAVLKAYHSNALGIHVAVLLERPFECLIVKTVKPRLHIVGIINDYSEAAKDLHEHGFKNHHQTIAHR